MPGFHVKSVGHMFGSALRQHTAPSYEKSWSCGDVVPPCVCRSRGTVGSTSRRSSTGSGGRVRSAAVSPHAAPLTPSRTSAATPTSSPRAAASASAAPRWTPCWPAVARAPGTRGTPADGLPAAKELFVTAAAQTVPDKLGSFLNHGGRM